MARGLHAGYRDDRLGQPVALRAYPGDRRRTLVTGELVGRGKPNGPGDILGARPPVALLAAALLLGEDVGPVSNVERADALRAFELVRPERHEVRAESLDVEVHVGCRLDRVD